MNYNIPFKDLPAMTGGVYSYMDVGAPFPESIGRCADLYHETRELRLAMDKEVASVKARETAIFNHIIENLSASDDTGAAGLKYRAQIVTKEVPKVADEDGGWPSIWDFIVRNKRFDLLQKRLNEKAVADTWKAGEAIPGVERAVVKTLSITKI